MGGVGRVTDTIDHHDYAIYLAQAAIRDFERIDIYDSLEEYALDYDLGIDDLSSGDVDKIRNIMNDIALDLR